MANSKKNIYVVQFGTGANINLLPLAAGQLYSSIKHDHVLMEHCNLSEIICTRPKDIDQLASSFKDVLIVGFSMFLWNMQITYAVARRVKELFSDALIVFGGPAIPKEKDLLENVFNTHQFIDVIARGEGEKVFVSLCKAHLFNDELRSIRGIIFRENSAIVDTGDDDDLMMENLPSPYLDGTFDEFYSKYTNEFSGVIWETNRGCPFECAFCTWGNLPSRRIREKSIEQVKGEIEWFGKNNIKYIAMADANFGIRERDVQLVELLAECKKKYGAPNFISVSWAKNSEDKVLKISEILKANNIGFRITLSLQSLNLDSLRVSNRINIKRESFETIKDAFYSRRLYSYTELILGLPCETCASYLDGLDELFNDNIFDQLYVYPLFLFPNTIMGGSAYRQEYGLVSKFIESRYTKSIEVDESVKEFVEMVVATKAMPREQWVDAFVLGYFALGIHNNRLAFFVLTYLHELFDVSITDFVSFARNCQKEYVVISSAFMRLENCAREVQDVGASHLIEPRTYGGIPFDPPEGIFLELILDKVAFYDELKALVKDYLEDKQCAYDEGELNDLFIFQEAVMAAPFGVVEHEIELAHNWIEYFMFTYQCVRVELRAKVQKFVVIDERPAHGDSELFLKNHFDVRGVPAFNTVYDMDRKQVFPPVFAEG